MGGIGRILIDLLRSFELGGKREEVSARAHRCCMRSVQTGQRGKWKQRKESAQILLTSWLLDLLMHNDVLCFEYTHALSLLSLSE